jgi:glycosyltransferase involved in cell wall biosynthesis
MNFLLFEDNVPVNPGSGGHVATLGLIEYLRAHGHLHIVNVVSASGLEPLTGPDVTVIHRSEDLVARKWATLLSPFPKMVSEIDWTAFNKITDPFVQRADRVIFGSARFLQLVRFPRVARQKTYYIADNVEWELALAMESNYRSPRLAQFDAAKIKFLESRGLKKVGKAAAFTARDAERLGALGKKEIQIIPPVLPPAKRPPKEREPFALYATNLNHPPNVDAMEWLVSEAWPRCERPLVVTGAGDFSHYAGTHHMEFRGFVSREELNDLYDRAGVVLNPTRTGSGFQIKLLEALAHNCPVVSTDFSNPLGKAIPSSNDPAEFAALVIHALADPTPFDYAKFYEDVQTRLKSFLDL